MLAEDLKEWLIFKNIADTTNFKKVFVFENKAIILRDNGTICGIGNNTHCLIGSNASGNYYPQMTVISDKKFKDLYTNGEHSLAISEEGFLYSWGSNEHGQLGRDGPSLPVSLVTKVFAVRIKEAACGAGLSCVLTEDGKVFEWGKYGFNEHILESDSTDNKKDEAKEDIEVVSIQGSKHNFLILTKSGKVFVPPCTRATNRCKRDLHSEKMNALEGSLKNKKIKQTVCGKSHAYALSVDGEIFYWDLVPVNACSCYGKAEPKRVAEKIGRVVKIWAASSLDVLVAADSFGSLYSITWSGPGVLLSISQIEFTTPGKYFAKLGIIVEGPVLEGRTMKINLEEKVDTLQDWRGRFDAAFNNKEDSDISFIFSEGTIYGHRAILSLQSSYLNAILNNDWKENSEDRHVVIKEYTYPTYLRFMRFLYTGKLEMSTHEGNLELLKLSHEYVDKPLLLLCKELVIEGLTAENAFSTYNVAHLLGLEDLRQACKRIISKNLGEIFLSEDITFQDESLIYRCIKDMICSKNIVGKD